MAEQANPYRPPSSKVAKAETLVGAEIAGKGRRFGTLVVDYICFMAFAFVFGVIVAVVFGQPGVEALESVPNFVLGFGIVFAYYVFFEGVWARTPGKLVFGTVVVTERGAKPSVGTVIKRTLCRFIPFEAFSFLGSRGWHDSISRTRVVRKRRF